MRAGVAVGLDAKRRERRGGLLVVLDDLHAVPRLVRGDHRLLEPREPSAIDAEVVGRAFESRALVGRDDAVLEHFGEELLVLSFERAEAEPARHLARSEARSVLEAARPGLGGRSRARHRARPVRRAHLDACAQSIESASVSGRR